MAQRLAACRNLLLLCVFLTASYGYAEEPRNHRVMVEAAARTRVERAASIPRRELELALRQREEVMAEVEQRIQELGLSASAGELTDLLGQRAHLELAIDKCRLDETRAGGC